MELDEYKEYLERKSKTELLGIKETLDRENFPDRYELLISELGKRDIETNDPNENPVVIENDLPKIYAGFWKRLGAYIIDLLILLPITYLSVWGGEQSRLFALYYFIPGLIFGIWFHAYLVKTYGGTPGKLLLKIKITKVDGTDVGYKEALLRYSVLLILTTVMSIAHIITTLNMTDQVYFSMEWMERAEYMNANMPSWYSPVVLLMNAWVWSEFVVMLLNKKRRAIHDYMAGTVVIYKGAEKHVA